ncbi:MAG TPA: hypothetical protein VIY47_06885 [Ignavibacteriaceae bacterium]
MKNILLVLLFFSSAVFSEDTEILQARPTPTFKMRRCTPDKYSIPTHVVTPGQCYGTPFTVELNREGDFYPETTEYMVNKGRRIGTSTASAIPSSKGKPYKQIDSEGNVEILEGRDNPYVEK